MMRSKSSFRYLVSRREVLAGGAGTVGAIGAGSLAAVSHSFSASANPVVRQDIATFQRSPQKVAALEAAVQEMQARSQKNPNDPKGWLVNANAHADYCFKPALGDPDQIHFCWWFLSWHRAYIAVTERKLRELSGDPGIAFPYWNWSSDRRIPSSFTRAGSPLAKALRDTPQRAIVDSEVDYFPQDLEKSKLVVAALGARFFEATKEVDIGKSFGGIARPNTAGAGGKGAYGNNRLEGVPHGPIHNYVGGDMADFRTAGRDPVFFAHHGNLDRLWEVWRKDPAHKATEPSSQAFKTHSFPFTWLDGTVITVTAQETLDTQALGYVYDSLDVLRPAEVIAMRIADNREAQLPPIATSNVSVPATVSQLGTPSRRYVLVITGVHPPDQAMTVGIYLKPISDNSSGPGVPAGSFAAVQNGGRVQFLETELRFDITGILSGLASGEFKVSLIPYTLGAIQREPYKPFQYEAMRIVAEE